MSLLVLTCVYNTDDSTWRCLRESAQRHGMELEVVGRGKPYPWIEAFRDLAIEARRHHPSHVIYTDAYDVLVNRWDAEEVIGLIEEQESGLLVSCNDECWPPGDWDAAYPPSPFPWRSACGGQMAGRKDRLIWLWEEFLSSRWSAERGGGNQEMLHRMKRAGVEFGLDTDCRVFQIMGHKSQPHIEVREGRAYNALTGSCPMFLHYGGRVPGMEEMFERRSRIGATRTRAGCSTTSPGRVTDWGE